MKKAWVKYGCGCCEGIWISEDSVCREHGNPVVETSDEVSLGSPFKDKPEDVEE